MKACLEHKARAVSAFALLASAGLLGADYSLAYEEPAYVTLEQHAEFELREYAPYVVAEVGVRGRFDEVGNRAFRVLFDYISGKNHGKQKMAMTVPVEQRPAVQGERTAMTPPVTQSGRPEDEDLYHFSFILPSAYSLADAPRPIDQRIFIREVPAKVVAARRYSGRWSEANYRKNERRLFDALDAEGFDAVGPPVYARYNSPFRLWFLRRNEVLVRVTR